MTASSAAAEPTMATKHTSANSPVASRDAGKGPAPSSPVARACLDTRLEDSVSPANALAVQSMPAGNGPAWTSPAEEEFSSDGEYYSLSDNDLSSWGSMDEVWDADSDYYDTEEEEEALAGTDVMRHANRCVSIHMLLFGAILCFCSSLIIHCSSTLARNNLPLANPHSALTASTMHSALRVHQLGETVALHCMDDRCALMCNHLFTMQSCTATQTISTWCDTMVSPI